MRKSCWLLMCTLACTGTAPFFPVPQQDGGSTPDASTPIPPGPGYKGPTVPAPFGFDVRSSNPTCLAPARPSPGGGVNVDRAFPNLSFNQPILLLTAPGETNRMFVVEQGGAVKVFANQDNTPSASTFLDITARVSSGGEKGLLGLAFHPSWATNRTAYLSYTRAGGPTGLQSVLEKFTSSDNGATLNPASGQILLTVDQPYENHNGGHIAFGPAPDHFLFFGLGDGGSGGDPENRAQNRTVLLGKMLRIDVDHGSPYAIPPSNPFADGVNGRAEIYAWGLRNPWRWSFDRGTGELWLGDVGQGAFEEVDKITLGGNYGWRVKEGFACYNAATCNSAGLIDPVVSYPRNEGISITGGYVYRGTAIPQLQGRFVYGDFGSGRLWAISTDPTSGAASGELLKETGLSISSFGEDPSGELYVVDYGGSLHKLSSSGTPPVNTFPTKLSETGCVLATDATKLVPGVIPYDVNAALWSDGALKERGFAIPDGTTITVGADGDWVFPSGTVLLKTFWLGDKRVETRLFIRHDDGLWSGYSYEWNDGQTDATLLTSSKTKTVGNQSWYFPSRAECMSCHTAAAGRSLGLETAQLNADYAYPTGRLSNQLATLDHLGFFSSPLGSPYTLPALARASGTLSDELKARAYLHANCSHCHRPTGTGRGPGDLRASTPLAQMSVCNVDPTQGSLGISGAKLLAPGSPAKSLISVRPHRLDANRMPPLATSVVDSTGLQVVDAWITSLSTCP
jgi:uncharacterized repeat protein (TIGR03806 family)